MSVLVAASIGGSLAATALAERSVTAVDGIVLARDLASESPAGDAVVMKLPRGTSAIELSEGKRIDLLRARFPGGHFTLRDEGGLHVVFEASVPRAAASGNCRVSRVDIPEGEMIKEEDLEPTECQRGKSGRWLTYDAASRFFFAQRAIPSGSYLGAARGASAAAADAGAQLIYRTSEGPITVEREVTALQSARPGHRLFVRTEDGRVLVSTLSMESRQ